jgi:hypothetical protein
MIFIPQESIPATGRLEIILVDAQGNIKDHRNVKNTVTISGKRYIANRMKETGRAPEMSHMALGTSVAGAGATDHQLGAESSAANHRVALATAGGTVASFVVGNASGGNTITYSANYPANGIATDVAVTEAGIFNYSTLTATGSLTTSQFMLCRTSFAVVNKLIADSLTINWTVTIN